MRNEAFNTASQIIRTFPETAITKYAGPVLLSLHNKEYIDPSESHVAFIGTTGSGKTQAGVMPFLRQIASKNENAIIVDPKGELFRNTVHLFGKNRIIVINLRNPRHSPDGYNPLLTPYYYYKSGCSDSKDIACSMVSEFWDGLMSPDKDPFWPSSASATLKGLTYLMYDYASDEEEVNVNSISAMLNAVKDSSLLKRLYDNLPEESLAKKALSTVAVAPNETRGSILSVANQNLEKLVRSQGLLQVLSRHTLDMRSLDPEVPYAIFLITPDETKIYDPLAGAIVSQLMKHLIASAEELGGSLRIRTNLILEELGSMGEALKDLPNWMSAGRSRNIRVSLVLQSDSQLNDAFGNAAAETIKGCVGTYFVFSSSNWDTMENWSRRCGERVIPNDPNHRTEALITPAQLASMDAGKCLVSVQNKYKFITRLPMFWQLKKRYGWPEPADMPIIPDHSIPVFDIKKVTENHHVGNVTIPPWLQRPVHSSPFDDEIHQPSPFASMDSPLHVDSHKQDHDGNDEALEIDVDEIIRNIDARIAELEAEEDAKKKDKLHKVTVVSVGGDKKNIARFIRIRTHTSQETVEKKLETLPAHFYLKSSAAAKDLIDKINATSGLAILGMVDE